MNNNYITLTIGKKKNIALIAHDNKKADLIEWCEQNKDILTQHFLCGILLARSNESNIRRTLHAKRHHSHRANALG